MRRRVLPLLLLLVIVAAACDLPNLAPPGDGPTRYRDQIFDAVTVRTGLVYGRAVNLENQKVTLKFDLYEPTGDTVTKRPAIVWVHGGSFCCGERTSPELVDEATTFAEEGYVNISIDYRLESPGCQGTLSNCGTAIQEAAADAQTAVRFLRDNARRYGVDRTRIAIGGSSSGAITALNVAYSSSEDPSSAVRAAVSLSGATVLVGTPSPGDAPAIDFHCTTDPLVPYSSAVYTIDAAQAAGLDAFLETWDETCHVPYPEHRQQILDQSRNFLYWEMDLSHAAT
jgi:acetyl esterase/lipase